MQIYADHVAGRLTVKELVGPSATSGVEAWKWQFAKAKSPGIVVKFVTSSHRLAECFYQLDVEHSGYFPAVFWGLRGLVVQAVSACKCHL